jgi:hypothetical protein
MEENIVEDQVQEVSEVSQETPQDTSQEQSEATKDEAEAKSEPFYVDHLGRQLTPEQLRDEYAKTQRYVTDLEKQVKQREVKIQQETAKAVSENELLQDVDPNVREAIVKIVSPVIQDAFRQKEAEAEKLARDNELRQKFSNAESKYDGKNGYPKFSRNAVTEYMLQNEVYDPERAYLLMNQPSIIDAEIRKAMKGKSTPTTESTVGSSPQKPEGKAPSSFEEASKRAFSRI